MYLPKSRTWQFNWKLEIVQTDSYICCDALYFVGPRNYCQLKKPVEVWQVFATNTSKCVRSIFRNSLRCGKYIHIAHTVYQCLQYNLLFTSACMTRNLIKNRQTAYLWLHQDAFGSNLFYKVTSNTAREGLWAFLCTWVDLARFEYLKHDKYKHVENCSEDTCCNAANDWRIIPTRFGFCTCIDGQGVRVLIEPTTTLFCWNLLCGSN